ncbi:MAG: helix-turn-helix domain-containing protein [Mycobacteriales bacterium]
MPIGETLASARLARQLSVEDVAAATRIRSTVIRAIESDDFDVCGGAVYARGHIRSIARVVGVEAQPLIDEFDRAHGGPPGGPATLGLTQFDPKADRSRRGLRANWWLAAAVSLVVIIAFAATLLVTSPRGGSAPKVTLASPTAVPSPSPRPSPLPSPSSSPSSSPKASPGVSVLARVLSGDSWFSVTNSAGVVLFQGLLYAGQQQQFTAARLLSLVIGNAPVVDLIVNGYNVGSPPAQGNVARVSYGPGSPSPAPG